MKIIVLGTEKGGLSNSAGLAKDEETISAEENQDAKVLDKVCIKTSAGLI